MNTNTSFLVSGSRRILAEKPQRSTKDTKKDLRHPHASGAKDQIMIKIIVKAFL
jgi:hypothetical protein